MVRPLLYAALGLSACGPPSFATTLDGNTTVPGGAANTMLAALPLIGDLSSLDFNDNADFKAHGITRADLVAVTVASATLSLPQPGADLSWLTDLQLVAKSGDAETVFADEIAFLTRAPPVSMSLTMTNNVTTEVAQAPMSFVMRGKGQQPGSDTQLKLELVLQVQATPSK